MYPYMSTVTCVVSYTHVMSVTTGWLRKNNQQPIALFHIRGTNCIVEETQPSQLPLICKIGLEIR